LKALLEIAGQANRAALDRLAKWRSSVSEGDGWEVVYLTMSVNRVRLAA
jgi:hypothetical protein